MGVATQVNYFWFYLFILFFSLTISSISGSEEDCVYTMYVRTSKKFFGGTDSVITLTLYDADGYGIRINNLVAWGGLMGSDHNYFKRGNLDIFSGRGPCLTGPVCKMNLTSDGSGHSHKWYCNYVEVTVTGIHTECNQQNFEVEHWLETYKSANGLTYISDLCDKTNSDKHLSISSENLPIFDAESIPHVAVM